jgi:hypothetical protein
MTANPLKLVETKQPKLSAQEWVDRGNAHLIEIGRAHEVHWFMQNGRPTIGWRV